MKLNTFKNYEEYRRTQTETNKEKIGRVWVSEKELEKVAQYVQEHIQNPAFGICHGVRNGYEVQKLRDLLNIEVIGTEISETAAQFPHVIQWDFHDVKDEWINQVDFIYSNSWDHSYDPEMMLGRWMSCVKPTGRCFLHWTRLHDEEGTDEADCFGASLDEMKQLVSSKYKLESTIEVSERLNSSRSMLANLGSLLGGKSPSRQIHVLVVKHPD